MDLRQSPRVLMIVAAGVVAFACSEPPPRTPPTAPDLVIPPLGSAHAMLAARDDVPLEPVAPPEASDATETDPAPPAATARVGCAADRAEIAAALAKVDFRSCVKTPPPMDAERTHLRITFERTGLVAAASLEGPFHSSPTGACMLERFHKLRIAPFCGGPITIGKNLRL